MKENLTGIQHIGIPSKDLGKTVEFYKKLGFEIVHEAFLEESGQNVKFLKLGNLVLETYDAPDATHRYGALDHIAINVKDIKKAYKDICNLGLNTLNDTINELPFWDKGVLFFTIEGPNKEKVEFSQYK